MPPLHPPNSNTAPPAAASFTNQARLDYGGLPYIEWHGAASHEPFPTRSDVEANQFAREFCTYPHYRNSNKIKVPISAQKMAFITRYRTLSEISSSGPPLSVVSQLRPPDFYDTFFAAS